MWYEWFGKGEKPFSSNKKTSSSGEKSSSSDEKEKPFSSEQNVDEKPSSSVSSDNFYPVSNDEPLIRYQKFKILIENVRFAFVDPGLWRPRIQNVEEDWMEEQDIIYYDW